MYFTYDNSIVIKTMTESEFKIFKYTLPNYFIHMMIFKHAANIELLSNENYNF